jgi:hypothetical protein
MINTSFDFRVDTPPGKDPDVRSPTLRTYHRELWSKPLPNGGNFDLVTTVPQAYLHHKSALGEFFLASDSVIPTFTRSSRIASVVQQVPQDVRDSFLRLSYTIGGMMVFPGNKIGKAMTINGARGCNYRIKDRFDLTVECIRRHYRHEESPLKEDLARYSDFFALFGDFTGYAQFFLLQDILSPDCSEVRFFLPFDGFQPWPLPDSVDSYMSYRREAEAFLHARNRRIRESQGASGTVSYDA